MTAILALLVSRWGARIGIIAGVLAALHFAAVHYRAEGRAQVRSEWQAANAKAAAIAVTLATQRAAAVKRATEAETAQAALAASTAASARASIAKGFHDAPATRVACLSPDILRRVHDSDAALTHPRAPTGRADPVHRAAPRGGR